MIFTDGSRSRGRFTAAEVSRYSAAADELGLDPRGPLTHGEATAIVLLAVATELGPEARALALAQLAPPASTPP